jgi:hypothetical protein
MARYFYVLGAEHALPDENTPEWIKREAALMWLWNIHEYLAACEELFLQDRSAAKYEILVRIRWIEMEQHKDSLPAKDMLFIRKEE